MGSLDVRRPAKKLIRRLSKNKKKRKKLKKQVFALYRGLPSHHSIKISIPMVNRWFYRLIDVIQSPQIGSLRSSFFLQPRLTREIAFVLWTLIIDSIQNN